MIGPMYTWSQIFCVRVTSYLDSLITFRRCTAVLVPAHTCTKAISTVGGISSFGSVYAYVSGGCRNGSTLVNQKGSTIRDEEAPGRYLGRDYNIPKYDDCFRVGLTSIIAS